MNILTDDPRKAAKRMEAFSRQDDYETIKEISAAIANALNRIAVLQDKVTGLQTGMKKINTVPIQQPDIKAMLEELADYLFDKYGIEDALAGKIRNWRSARGAKADAVLECDQYRRRVAPKAQENIKPTTDDKNAGLKAKYQICHADGTSCDHNAEYFVLRLDFHEDCDKTHISACRQAIRVYAELIKQHLPFLSADLISIVGKDDTPAEAQTTRVEPEGFKDQLTDHLDLMIDEFSRIKTLTEDTEIIGLCDRAILLTKQNVPVIVQRDNWERKYWDLDKQWSKRYADLKKDLARTQAKEERFTVGEIDKFLLHRKNHFQTIEWQACVDSLRRWIKSKDDGIKAIAGREG